MKNIVEYKQCQVFNPFVRFVNCFSLDFLQIRLQITDVLPMRTLFDASHKEFESH